jgi:zinc protease
MNRLLIALVVLCAATVAQAKEDQPLPKDLPAYAAERPLPVARIEQRTLRNGLTVWVVPREGLPKIDAVLAVRGGSASDPAERRGMASVLAGLLTEGTQTRSSRELAEALQAVGGSISANASLDGVTVFANAGLSQRERLLELLGDVVQRASFPDAEFALAKANALQALKVSEASPGFLATRAMAATVYGAHAYSRGTAVQSALEALTREDIVAAHAARFRPERALLVISGRVEPRAMFRLVDKYFGAWRGQGAAAAEVAPVPVPATFSPQRVIVDRPGSIQASVRVGRLGVSATSPDAIALAVTNTVLGGGFNSRITNNIREDKGYTYSPSSSVSRGLLGGVILASAEVRNEVTAATINELLYEFERVGTTPVAADELERAKRYFAGLYLLSNQIQSAVAATLASNWLVGLPAEYLGTYVDQARAVTPEQVRDVARRYYPSRLQNLVIVGDRKAIDAELAQYGEFTAF